VTRKVCINKITALISGITVAIKRIILNKRMLPSRPYVLTIECIRLLHMSNLSTCVRKLRRWHEQKHHSVPNYPGWPTSRQTDEEDLNLKAHSKTVIVSVFMCKLKALANSKGSYPLADMETSNNTLDPVHSIFIR